MTAPEQPDEAEVETPQPPPADEGAMLTIIFAAIAAYLAARTVVKGPWRNTAAVLNLTKLAGNGFGALSRRSVTRQVKALPKATGAVVFSAVDDAVAAGTDAGIEHLVRTIYSVQDRMIAAAAAGSTRPSQGGTPGPDDEAAAAATQAAPAGTTTGRSAPQPGSREAADLGPRDVLSDATLGNIARDLVDTIVHTATTTAIAAAEKLTRGWSKTWVSAGDVKVREAHRLLTGVTIGVLDTFTTPEGEIRYPHDPTAPVGLTANCRCTLRFTYRRKADRARTAALVPQARLADRDLHRPDAAVPAGLIRVSDRR